MHFKKHVISALSFALCAVLTLLPLTASAKSASDYRQTISEAQAKSNELKAQINKLKEENAPYEEQKEALLERIAAIEAEINVYNQQISEYNDEISALEEKISDKEKELEENKNIFKQRLVAMYKTGNTGEIVVLLSADDFGDFLAKTELMRRVSEHDQELLDKIISSIDEIKSSKSEVESKKAEKDAAKALVVEKKKELDSQYDEVNAIVESNNESIADLESKEASYKKMVSEAEENLKKLQSSGNTISGTGQFRWPVPGYYSISSYYGYRWGRLHGGIDISSSGIYGARIVAADTGTVILSTNYDYGGYGYCVMIDHGNGYVTLYAHMKSPSPLSVGSHVTKGETTVGYVGSTGRSTGPHLHFEIRVNGSRENPMNWF